MSANQRTFYVTAAIDYVNARPHLGTAYEKIGCDILFRYFAQNGYDVRFTMGSDEHSQSVERSARAEGMTPQAFCERQKDVFLETWDAFDLHPTAYVRTDSEENRSTTDHIMTLLHDQGYIYKGAYKAWFCPSCEQFYTDKQLVNEQCPVHERPVEWVEEENYFFALSKFQAQLAEHFTTHPEFLVPESRRNEIWNVIEGGLEDISISRAFTTWGIPLPFDNTQVVYVWFDALLSYLTGIGFPLDMAQSDRFWPVDVHVIGKDITRFHAVMWPAMLMAAGLPLPKRIHAHGFITLGGQKMSKTRGIFLDPLQLVNEFGSDAVRWVLMAEIPFDRDGDFSMEVFVDRYNADLANDYGNLVSRTVKMVDKYFKGAVPAPASAEPLDDELRQCAVLVVERYDAAMPNLDFTGAVAAVKTIVGRANKYIEEVQPWTLNAKGDPRLQTVCRNLLEVIRVSTFLMQPFIPQAAARVAHDLDISLTSRTSALASDWLQLRDGGKVGVGEILFPRLDRSIVLGHAAD